MTSYEIFFATLVFFLGASLGSFFSVVIYRVRNGKSGIISGRSFCPNCKKKLHWFQLIPVFSYLFSGGKCYFGKEKIPKFYLAIEVFTGILFLLAFLDFTNLKFLIFHLIIFSFLSLIFFYDYLYQEIPDRFSLPAIIFAFLGNFLLESNLTITEMLIGALIIGGFFFLQFVISKGKWVGGGDIRLGALMGIFLGWKLGLVALISAYIIGSIFGIGLVISKKLDRKSAIAFGPFLVLGTIIAFFYGEKILNWYTNLLI